MGKLRHGALPAPDPSAWRAAATSAPPTPLPAARAAAAVLLQLSGDLGHRSARLGTGFGGGKQGHQSPLLHCSPSPQAGPAPIVHSRGPPASKRPRRAAPCPPAAACAPRAASAPRPRWAPGCKTSACSARRGMPEATSLGDSIKGTGDAAGEQILLSAPSLRGGEEEEAAGRGAACGGRAGLNPGLPSSSSRSALDAT